MTRLGFVFVILLGAATAAFAQPPTIKPACDRTCLEGYVDKYLDAMLANEVSPTLFARVVKFTENGIRLPLGNEGLWYGMSGRGTYKFYVPDVETQQVAFIGSVRENVSTHGANDGQGAWVALALRLKVVDGLIAEVEQLAIRPDGAIGFDGVLRINTSSPELTRNPGEKVERMGEPHPLFKEVIPPNQRPSREALVETANYYFTGLARNDHKGYYPFTDGCVRVENGTTTTTDCKKEFERELRGFVSRIRDRRFVAVDRERGIVFAFIFFDHERTNRTLQIAELFKIEDGKIRRAEAVLHRAPYGIPSGWSTYEQSISEAIQSVR